MSNRVKTTARHLAALRHALIVVRTQVIAVTEQGAVVTLRCKLCGEAVTVTLTPGVVNVAGLEHEPDCAVLLLNDVLPRTA